MTANQLQYQRNVQEAVHNQLTRAETERSNRAREAETARSNLAQEAEAHRSNTVRESETRRSNLAQEAETKRHNLFGEDISSRSLAETIRSNMAREQLTHESNVASQLAAQARMESAKASQQGVLVQAMNAATNARELAAKEPLYRAQVGTETQRAINFGSGTKLNLQKANESRSVTQYNDAKRKTENWQRLPNTINSYVGIVGNVVNSALGGLKLFGGAK